jgi:hypothetical protein
VRPWLHSISDIGPHADVESVERVKDTHFCGWLYRREAPFVETRQSEAGTASIYKKLYKNA